MYSCVSDSFMEKGKQHSNNLYWMGVFCIAVSSSYRAFGLVKILLSVWHGVEKMGILGKSLEWMVQRAFCWEKICMPSSLASDVF